MAKKLIFKLTPAPVRDEAAEMAAKAAAAQSGDQAATGKIWKTVPVGEEHISAMQAVTGVVGVVDNGDHAMVHVMEDPLHDREIAILRLRQIFGTEPDYQGFDGFDPEYMEPAS